MLDVIEIGVVRNPVSQVNAHAFPDFLRAWITVLKLILNKL